MLPFFFSITATDAGLIFLDSIDFYINFVFLLLGFFETFGAGWVFGIEEQIEELGTSIVFTYMFANFGSVIIACCIWFGLDSGNEVWAGFLALILCYVAGTGVALFFCSLKIKEDPEKWNWSNIVYATMLKNVMDLREELETISGYMPWAWAFGMKHVIPQILLIAFINLARADNGAGDVQFGNYEGYVTYPYQFLGMVFVVFSFFTIVIGVVLPALFEPFDLTTIDMSPTKDVSKMAAGEEEDGDGDDDDEMEKDEVDEA
jgi:hypothetical protein